MSLFEAFYEPCVMMEKRKEPDGLGGYKTEWLPGAEFQAAVIKNDTLQAAIAEKQGVTEVYSITTPVGVGLDYNDVFRRVSDKATFRVTTNATDSKTPKMASFSFERVKAERWELT